MEREVDLLKRVAEFLVSHGYPEDSLILEWPISKGYRVDLAVIDPVTKKPVALFEFKRQKSESIMRSAIKQLKKYAAALGDEEIPTYVVFGSDVDPFYELYFVSEEEDETELKRLWQFPVFTYLKTSLFSKELVRTEKEKEDTFNEFKIISWFLAGLLIILLILDFNGRVSLTSERLFVILLIISLIIIPYASKLKFLGIEFERLQER